MGACVSSCGVVGASETAAILILCHGDSNSNNNSDLGTGYVEFKDRRTVAEAAKGYPKDCFICSWEGVQVGEKLTELKPWQHLELGEIYFLLPRRKLRFQITVEDMSALLCRAASALKSLPSCPLFLSFSEDSETDSQLQTRQDLNGSDSGMQKCETVFPKDRRDLRPARMSRRQSRWKSQWINQLDTIVEVV